MNKRGFWTEHNSKLQLLYLEVTTSIPAGGGLRRDISSEPLCNDQTFDVKKANCC